MRGAGQLIRHVLASILQTGLRTADAQISATGRYTTPVTLADGHPLVCQGRRVDTYAWHARFRRR